MKTICVAGTLGRDAEVRNVGDSDVCSFSVAVDDGFGDKKTTVWFDVSRWGKGASGLANVLVKGSRVALSGDLTTRENNGKTYLQIRADKVSILSTPQGGQKSERREPDGSRGGSSDTRRGKAQDWGDDLSDDIPFITNRSVY